MKLKLFLTSLFALNIIVLNAGTIIYKTSRTSEEHRLAKVKIISISQGAVTVKHGKGVRTIPLSYLKGYYDTDIDVGGFADNTCDYTVSIRDIKMPKTGYTFTKVKKSKKKSRKTSNCEIEFSVNKKAEKGKFKSIRMPYFYLFVLTTGSKTYGQRPIYSFYYPEEAKVKSKTYDEAKFIEAINSMERPRIYHGEKSSFSGKVGKLTSASGYRPAVIELKKIKNQKIIAYRLEVWGKDKMIFEKKWKNSSYKVGKNWWKRY
jgi:hypothetical protein